MFLNILKKKFSEAKKISIKRKKKIAFLIGNTIKVEVEIIILPIKDNE